MLIPFICSLNSPKAGIVQPSDEEFCAPVFCSVFRHISQLVHNYIINEQTFCRTEECIADMFDLQ